jgi:hypothetical protein
MAALSIDSSVETGEGVFTLLASNNLDVELVVFRL